ncbi:hypothetical protein [Rhodococcus koreensis]|uniref:hypothetical protein n=1 Tax=Rhodococcus koreensis TaxID=99653 RepID=UPI0036733D36
MLEALTDRVLTTDILGESEGEREVVVGFVKRRHGFTRDGHRPPSAHLTLAFPSPPVGPAQETPAVHAAETEGSDSGVGPAHQGGVGKAEDNK